MAKQIIIEDKLYAVAQKQAKIEHQSVARQIESWAKVGKAALDNPDLPIGFIKESMISLAEPRVKARPFKSRSVRPAFPKSNEEMNELNIVADDLAFEQSLKGK